MIKIKTARRETYGNGRRRIVHDAFFVDDEGDRISGAPAECGKTAADARQSLLAFYLAAATGSYVPLVVSHAGWMGMLWREPRGYKYMVQRTDEFGDERLHGGGAYATYEKAERKMRLELARFIAADGGNGSAVIRHENDLVVHLGEMAWQRRYTAWREAGASDHEAHTQASQGRLPPNT